MNRTPEDALQAERYGQHSARHLFRWVSESATKVDVNILICSVISQRLAWSLATDIVTIIL